MKRFQKEESSDGLLRMNKPVKLACSTILRGLNALRADVQLRRQLSSAYRAHRCAKRFVQHRQISWLEPDRMIVHRIE